MCSTTSGASFRDTEIGGQADGVQGGPSVAAGIGAMVNRSRIGCKPDPQAATACRDRSCAGARPDACAPRAAQFTSCMRFRPSTLGNGPNVTWPSVLASIRMHEPHAAWRDKPR
jgi:hypothetical protein